jgi:hypothetical protein
MNQARKQLAMEVADLKDRLEGESAAKDAEKSMFILLLGNIRL